MSWAETCTSKPNPAFLAIELVSSWTILAWMHGVECVTMEQDASIGEKHYVGGYIVKTTRKTGLGWWGKLKKSTSWKEWPSHLRLAHMSITPFGESRSLSLNKYLEIVELQNFLRFMCVSYWIWVAELQKGVRYGCPLEDVITGLQIQCRGWRSVYYNPERKGFLGMAPISLGQILVQHKRWTEGFLQISLSKYSPFLLGHRKIRLGLQMGYSVCGFWALNSFPTLYYVTIPSLCFLNGISLFPEVR